MSRFLLDTSVIWELVKTEPDANVVRWVGQTGESVLFLSLLTLGEIRKGIELLASGRERRRLERWLDEDFRQRFQNRILTIDGAIADRWGIISALAGAKGRQVPVIDGLLAATALERDLTLVTRNDSDVAPTAVTVANPWLQAPPRAG